MKMEHKEYKRIYRLRDRYGITTGEARAAYFRNDRDTRRAAEEIRINLIFNIDENGGGAA